MKSIVLYIKEHLILEYNDQFYPHNHRPRKFYLFYGENEYDHVQTRMYERDVTENDIIDSFKKIFNELNNDFKNKKLLANELCDKENINKNQFIIFNKQINKVIVAYLWINTSLHKLDRPRFVIKTVFNSINFKPKNNDIIYKIE